MTKYLYLSLGCLIGGFARFFLAGSIYKRWGTGFPIGTLIVNLSGCLLIGLFNTLAEEKFLLGTNGRLLLMTGFCGAYTTFSTFTLETSNLMNNQEFYLALGYVALSVVLGFILFRMGGMLGRWV